jgi:3-oxoacyl-[acyl-carrier protein] reductase
MILNGKVALVTGGGFGIGRAIALGFGLEGAHVVINYHKSEASAKDVVSQIRKMGREAVQVQGDVAMEEDIKKIVSAAMDAFGRIDILVNNAGIRTITLFGADYFPVLEMKVKDWDRLIAINLRGLFMMSKAVLPHMIEQKQGSIINISSGAGRVAVPGKSAYTASKFGLEGFTRALAGEVKHNNIRVNALAPGGRVDVDGLGGFPENVIVPASIFLASDDSKDVSGESIIAVEWNKERGIEI